MGCWYSSAKPPQSNVAESPFTVAAGIAAAHSSAALATAGAKSSSLLADHQNLLLMMRSQRDLFDPSSNVDSACSGANDPSGPAGGVRSARNSTRKHNPSTGCCPQLALLETMTSSHRQLPDVDFEDHAGQDASQGEDGEFLCAVATLAVDVQEATAGRFMTGTRVGSTSGKTCGGADDEGSGAQDSDSGSDLLKSSRHLLQHVVPLLLNPSGGGGGQGGAAPRVPPTAPAQGAAGATAASTAAAAQPPQPPRPAASAADGQHTTGVMAKRPTFVRGLTRDSFLLNNTTTGGTTAYSGYMLRTATGRGELLHADAHWTPFHMGNPLQVVVGELLGRGGCGSVYQGQWRGRPVAVKVVQQVVAPPAGPAAGVAAAASGTGAAAPPPILTPLIDYFGSSSGVSSHNPARQNTDGAAVAAAATGPRAPYLPDAHASVKRLRHPNVLRTYAYAVLSTAPQLGGVLPARHEHHVVLELCDGGSLRSWLDRLYSIGDVGGGGRVGGVAAIAAAIAAARGSRDEAGGDARGGAVLAPKAPTAGAAGPAAMGGGGCGGGGGGAAGADAMTAGLQVAMQALERAQAHLDSRLGPEQPLPADVRHGPGGGGSGGMCAQADGGGHTTSGAFPHHHPPVQASKKLLQQLQQRMRQHPPRPSVPVYDGAAAAATPAPASIGGHAEGAGGPLPPATLAAVTGGCPAPTMLAIRQGSTAPAACSATLTGAGHNPRVESGQTIGGGTDPGANRHPTGTGVGMMALSVSTGAPADGDTGGGGARAARLEPCFVPPLGPRKESQPGGAAVSAAAVGLDRGRSSLSDAISKRLPGLTASQSEQLQRLGIEWVSDSQGQLARLTSGSSAGRVGDGGGGGAATLAGGGGGGGGGGADKWMTTGFDGDDDDEGGVAVPAMSEPSTGAAQGERSHVGPAGSGAGTAASATAGASGGGEVPLPQGSCSGDGDGRGPRLSPPFSLCGRRLPTSLNSDGDELWPGTAIHAYANASLGSAGGSTMVRPESSGCTGFQAVHQHCVVLDDDPDDERYSGDYCNDCDGGSGNAPGSDGRLRRGDVMYDASGSASGHVHAALFGSLRIHGRLGLLEEGSGEGRQSSRSRCDSTAVTTSTAFTTTPTDTTTAAEAALLQRLGTHVSGISSGAGGGGGGAAASSMEHCTTVSAIAALPPLLQATLLQAAVAAGAEPEALQPPTLGRIAGPVVQSQTTQHPPHTEVRAALFPLPTPPGGLGLSPPPASTAACAGGTAAGGQPCTSGLSPPGQQQQQQPLQGEFDTGAVTALLNRRAMGMVNSILKAAGANCGGAGASEPMSGQQLRHLVTALGCLVEIAAGLSYLHGIGMVHGDVKSGNVLLKIDPRQPRGFVLKLADFGFSRVIEHGSHTYLSRPSGTLAYLSPEMLTSYRQSSAADQYAFGLLVWEVVTTQPLFRGLQTPQLLYAKTHNADWQYLQWPPWCPPEVRALARRCAEYHPAARLTAAEARSQLEVLRAHYKGVLTRSSAGDAADASNKIAPAVPLWPSPSPAAVAAPLVTTPAVAGRS